MIFKKIENKYLKLEGHLGFYYESLVDETSFGINENDEFLAASVIKFPIYCIICKLVNEGVIKFSEEIIVSEKDKLPSCGALNSITGKFKIDIESLCNLMITISDNSATNLLIKRVGIKKLNQEFIKIGLNKTHIERLLFDSKAAKNGLENKICLKELGSLLKQIYKGEFINSKYSNYILNCLKKQQINHKIPGYLNDCVEVAHKTGEDDNLTNDVGIIFANKPFILCFAGHDTDVTKYEILIREVSKMLVDYNNQ